MPRFFRFENVHGGTISGHGFTQSNGSLLAFGGLRLRAQGIGEFLPHGALEAGSDVHHDGETRSISSDGFVAQSGALLAFLCFCPLQCHSSELAMRELPLGRICLRGVDPERRPPLAQGGAQIGIPVRVQCTASARGQCSRDVGRRLRPTHRMLLAAEGFPHRLSRADHFRP
jgi:hypothetical protein